MINLSPFDWHFKANKSIISSTRVSGENACGYDIYISKKKDSMEDEIEAHIELEDLLLEHGEVEHFVDNR